MTIDLKASSILPTLWEAMGGKAMDRVTGRAAGEVTHDLRAVVAVVIDVDGDMAVVEAGGRYLGIDGLSQPRPGMHLALRLPAGPPGIGGTVEAHLVDAEPTTALIARLVPVPRSAWAVTLSRPGSGERVEAVVRVDISPAQQAEAVSGFPVPIDAVLPADGDGEHVLLRTADGEFLAPRGTPGLSSGRRASLHFLPGLPGRSGAEGASADPRAAVVREAGAGLAVALAAMVERSSGALSPAKARSAGRPCPDPEDDVRRSERQSASWVRIPERLDLAGAEVDVQIERIGSRIQGKEVQRVRGMLLTVAFSRLGRVELALTFDQDHAELEVVSADHLDDATVAELREVMAAASSMWRGRLRVGLAVGSARRPERAATAGRCEAMA